MDEPKDLSKRQKIVWRWLKKMLPDSVDYEQIDETVVVLLINQMIRNADAARIIEAEGMTTIGSRGQPVVSAFVKIESDSAKEIVKLSNELGLSPKARRIMMGAGSAGGGGSGPEDEGFDIPSA